MTNDALNRILGYFDEILPNAGCELVYRQPHELLIAVILSAQTTDAKVNAATPRLFQAYPTVASLAAADSAEVEEIIRAIGLYKTKARHIVEATRMLRDDFGGLIPKEKQDLLKLPGVGRKTAAVVRAELFHEPEIAVDTHVSRIAKRLGWAAFTDDVNEIERKLRKRLPVSRYIKTHHQMLHFGRYFCLARKPKCSGCPLADLCREPHKNLTEK